MTGFKIKDGVRGESFNSEDYARLVSVSRQEVGASLITKINTEIKNVNKNISDDPNINYMRLDAYTKRQADRLPEMLVNRDSFDMAEAQSHLQYILETQSLPMFSLELQNY